jgi:hypothetical protein
MCIFRWFLHKSFFSICSSSSFIPTQQQMHIYCTQPKKNNWQVVLASVAGHGQKESHHITAVTYYCTIVVHLLSLLIIWGSWIKVLPIFKTKSPSVPLSQAAGIKVAGSAIQKLAILRETSAGDCHSAGRSSAFLKRRILRVTSACWISVSHQLATASVSQQPAVFQCRSRLKV